MTEVLSVPSSGSARDSVQAGDFGEWLAAMRRALRGHGGMEVPCGSCTGCCTSDYSVQLRPQDRRAAARIPQVLLESPPGFPPDHRTLRPLASGVCPMLDAGRCSIYEVRPQTCLDFDCRVFAAAGIEAGGASKAAINERVRHWRFGYPAAADEQAHRAVRSAAGFIRERRDCFTVPVPASPMGIAVWAIKACGAFMEAGAQERDDAQTAASIVRHVRLFDEGAPVG